MAAPLVVLLALCGVFCLGPMAIYLSWLAVLNRRPRPSLLRGTSDLMALLVGLSGFLGLGGLLLIMLVHSNARFLARGSWEQIRSAWHQEQSAWLFLACVYALILVLFIGWLALARRRTLMIYHIDRWFLDRTLDELLTDLGLVATRTGNLWTTGQAIVEVNHFDGFCHASLTLHTPDQRLAEEIERELRRRLLAAPEPENPAAVWILWASFTCLMVMLGCLLMVLYYLYLVKG